MAIETFMTRSVTIESPPSTDDGMGGETGSWSSASTALCAIFPATANEIYEWDRLGERVTNKLYFPIGTSITTKQRVKYGSIYYNVRGVMTPGEMTKANTACAHIKVMAEKVT